MLKTKTSREIPTKRAAKSFRSIPHSTGLAENSQDADAARVLLEQEKLSARQDSKAAVNEQWDNHYEAAISKLPPSARSKKGEN